MYLIAWWVLYIESTTPKTIKKKHTNIFFSRISKHIKIYTVQPNAINTKVIRIKKFFNHLTFFFSLWIYRYGRPVVFLFQTCPDRKHESQQEFWKTSFQNAIKKLKWIAIYSKLIEQCVLDPYMVTIQYKKLKIINIIRNLIKTAEMDPFRKP